MTDYFGEKSSQIEPATLKAFGITIFSRYGDAGEIKSMIEFAKLVALRKVNNYVIRVFYDSKSCICNFDLSPDVKEGDAVADTILECARQTIAQFNWFGGFETSEEFAADYG